MASSIREILNYATIDRHRTALADDLLNAGDGQPEKIKLGDQVQFA
jgi:hypothetical protein